MVSTSTVTNAVRNVGQHINPKNMKLGAVLGAIPTIAFCAMDFVSAPSAFDLKYDTDGNKVEGSNSKSGWKEVGKCAIKCLGYAAIPAAIGGLLAGVGFGVVASLGAGILLSTVFDKVLPSEHKLVAKACEEKGIDYKPEEPNLFTMFA